METKVTRRKWIAMDDKEKKESPQLQRMYVRSDAKFMKRLKVAIAMRGGDQSDFLREAADLYICGIFAANGGNLGIQLESND